jgi:hypothetical protein
VIQTFESWNFSQDNMEFKICHCVAEDPESAYNNGGERTKIKKTALKRQSIRSDPNLRKFEFFG